jgi:(p)ppGpp synthase/HD superfamily hydrolase
MNNITKYLSEEEFNSIKNEKNLYTKALNLVTILFKDKNDKEGEPYLNHLLRVSNGVDKYDTKVAGLLHDTVEDIKYITYEDLLDIGITKSIIDIVKIVTTENKTKSYHKKITSILESGNIEAIKLKYSDMSDNANPERLSKLNVILRNRLHKKYDEELDRLRKYLERS